MKVLNSHGIVGARSSAVGRIVAVSRIGRSTRSLRLPVASIAVMLATGLLAGCYEHVTQADFTAAEVKATYSPNVEEDGPSWLNEFMWGDPPKGEDPVKYYRRKNSFGIQK